MPDNVKQLPPIDIPEQCEGTIAIGDGVVKKKKQCPNLLDPIITFVTVNSYVKDFRCLSCGWEAKSKLYWRQLE